MSKSLLGAQFRAEVGAFIAVGEAPFWARGMSRQLEIPENKVAGELSRFAAGGLLSAMTMSLWDRRRLYERSSVGTSYWDLSYELVQRAASDEALRLGIDASTVMDSYLAAVHGEPPSRRRVSTEKAPPPARTRHQPTARADDVAAGSSPTLRAELRGH